MPSSNPKKNFSSSLKLFNEYTIQICREGMDWEKEHISFPAFLTIAVNLPTSENDICNFSKSFCFGYLTERNYF